MILAELVKAYRESQGMSIRQMSKLTGIEHTALWRFEQGRFLRVKQFTNLVRWVFSEKKA